MTASVRVVPIAAGFALAFAVFIAGPVTGGAVKPVRALGPMLSTGPRAGSSFLGSQLITPPLSRLTIT